MNLELDKATSEFGAKMRTLREAARDRDEVLAIASAAVAAQNKCAADLRALSALYLNNAARLDAMSDIGENVDLIEEMRRTVRALDALASKWESK